MDELENISPELEYASPMLRGLIELGHDASTIGIDPALALTIVAAVPVVLRLLRMGNEFTSAIANDLAEKKRLDRKREELELEQEFHERREASKFRHKEFQPGKPETRGEPLEGVYQDAFNSMSED